MNNLVLSLAEYMQSPEYRRNKLAQEMTHVPIKTIDWNDYRPLVSRLGMFAAEVAPGSGDYLAAKESGNYGRAMWDSLGRGEYKNALGNLGMSMAAGVGVLPMIPSLTGMVKSVKSGSFIPSRAKTLKDVEGYDFSYRGGHTAPVDPEYHAPLYEMNKTYPDDIYSNNAMRYYGHGDPDLDAESFDIISKVRGNPDADVTVYRAVPLDAPSDILPGDWVTINKKYAKQHGDGLGKFKILKTKVKAKQLRTDGNSPHEFGYTGEE